MGGAPANGLDCRDCSDLVGGYVLGALEPAEADAVRRHVETCADCAREHERLRALPAALDAAGSADAPPERPPAALEEAVLDRFAREQGGPPPRIRRPAAAVRRLGRFFRRPLRAALAGAAVGAVAAAIAAALIVTSDPPETRSYGAVLAGTPASPDAHAYAELEPVASGTRVHLEVEGLPRDTAAVYELWCVKGDGGKVSAGTFRVDRQGRADVRLTTALRLSEYQRLSVERRAAGGTKGGDRVLAGGLRY